MTLEYDEKLKNLVKTFTPQWTEIRVDTRDFSKVNENSFVTGAVLLIGQSSLLCCMTAKDSDDDLWEYYPIYLKVVDENKYAPDEWVTLARKSGTAELNRKLHRRRRAPLPTGRRRRTARKRPSASTMAWKRPEVARQPAHHRE